MEISFNPTTLLLPSSFKSTYNIMTAANESASIATQAPWNEGRDLIPREVKTGKAEEAAAGDEADS